MAKVIYRVVETREEDPQSYGVDTPEKLLAEIKQLIKDDPRFVLESMGEQADTEFSIEVELG